MAAANRRFRDDLHGVRGGEEAIQARPESRAPREALPRTAGPTNAVRAPDVPEHREVVGSWVGVVIVSVFLWNVARYFFLADDAYISFRYGRHLGTVSDSSGIPASGWRVTRISCGS